MRIDRQLTYTWTPRILCAGMAIFLSLFALDSFHEGKGIWAGVGAFLVHLVPTYIVLGVLALAWRRPWLGALGMGAAGIGYWAMAWRHPIWVLGISGPLFAIAVLYLCSWRLGRSRG